MQPTSWSDTVGNIGELVWTKDFDKVLENGGLDKIRMEFGNTIDLVGTNNGQVSHSDHLWLRLLNDRDTGEKLAIVGEFALHRLQEQHINLVDNLKMSWEEILEQGDGPFLQRFWENGMVGVAELAECQSDFNIRSR